MSTFGSPEIPDRCQGCPLQCELGSDRDDLMSKKRLKEMIGASLVGKDGEHFDDMIDAHVPPEVADRAKHGVRAAVGDNLEEIENRIIGAQEEGQRLARDCPDVLKLRTSRDGTTYRVDVCGSPEAYPYTPHDPLPHHVPAHVRTKRAQT